MPTTKKSRRSRPASRDVTIRADAVPPLSAEERASWDAQGEAAIDTDDVHELSDEDFADMLRKAKAANRQRAKQLISPILHQPSIQGKPKSSNH